MTQRRCARRELGAVDAEQDRLPPRSASARVETDAVGEQEQALPPNVRGFLDWLIDREIERWLKGR